VWEQATDAAPLRFLRDHVVEDVAIVPGAAWLEAAAAAVAESAGASTVALADVRFENPLALDAPRVYQVVVSADHTFAVASRPRDAADAWTTHARGRGRGVVEADGGALDLEVLQKRLAPRDVDALYAALSAHDFHYGPVFRAIRALWASDVEVLARLEAPGAERFAVHPAILDASFQALAAVVDASGDKPAVPIGVDRLRVRGRCGAPAWAHVRRRGGEELTADIRIADASGRVCVEVDGLRVAPLERADASAPDELWYRIAWERREPEAVSRIGRWAVLGDDGVAAAIEAAGGEVVRAAAPAEALAAPSCRGVVCVASAGERCWAPALEVAQGLAGGERRRLVLVTRGAVPVGTEPMAPLQATVWGLGRSIGLEHPELECRLVDRDDGLEGLARAIAADDGESQVALRGGQRFVARLAPGAPDARPAQAIGDMPWRVEVGAVGQLDLGLVETERRAPGPGEVEIEVEAAGINFIDVLTALGALGDSVPKLVTGTDLGGLGAECAGRVVRVGAGVSVQPGRRVLAAGSGCLARYVTTPATLAVPVPERLGAAEAAALPIAYATVLHALKYVARLEAGERVLIHSATGGVGLAAIAWARHVGAEVYATAGSPAKRDSLRQIGIERVSDSRSLQFVEDVRSWTAGEGVDVVLNSLAGPLLAAGVDLLRDHGRFVELGKRDVLENAGLGLRPFLRNLTFSLVDLIGMLRKRPAQVRALLDEVVGLVESGALPPLPVRSAPADEVVSLFREMAGARHVGKLVMTPPSARARVQRARFRPRRDRSYLITGGLGGLGRAVAVHLARRGAGHLVLVGRGPASSEAQTRDLDAIRACGATVTVARADVADRESLRALLAGLPAPLAGVVHAAGVLGEQPLRTLDAEAFESVLRPKVKGALNLHELTRDRPLDFFLLFSSASAVLGGIGQAHYAAANAYLDALAHHRRSLGLPATSLDFGPIARVGMAARREVEARFERMGIRYLSPETMLAAIDRALDGTVAQAAVLSLDPRGGGLAAQPTPFLSGLARASTAANGIAASLRALGAPERRGRLEQWLREKLAAVLGASLDDVAPAASFSELGLDSLMALELRNRVESELGLSVSATVALSHDSVTRLAAHLAARIEQGSAKGEADDLPIEELPKRVELDAAIRPPVGEPMVPARRALLTGATGFVGAYLLHELLARGLEVECVVRASADRVGEALRGFGLWQENRASQLAVHEGDLAQPRLGLSEADFAGLAERVDLVVHAGAAVNWVLPYGALEAVNVGGTREVLRLCATGRPKVLHHVSTLGVVGVYRALGQTPPGTDPGARLPRLLRASGYFQTKWVAEQFVLEARRSGLRTSIHRPGLVTGDSRTGADSATTGQFFFSLLKGCIQMGRAPDWGGQLRLVPVDYVARAIATLALHPDGQDAVVNLTSHRPLAFGAVVDTLRRMGFFLLTEDYGRWREDVLALPETSPSNPLAAFAPFLRGLPADEPAALEAFGAADPLDDALTRDLLRSAGLECPPTDDRLIADYVRWYVGAGALAPPASDVEAGTEIGTL
jgi:thioester reductase-like protein